MKTFIKVQATLESCFIECFKHDVKISRILIMKKSPSAALAENYNSVVRERHVVNILCISSSENHQNNMRIPTYCKK